MKITCDAKRFALGCTIARMMKRTISLPATWYALIEATEGKAVLKATNLQTYITFDLLARVEEEGKVFIHPKRGLEFAKRESGRIGMNSIGKNDVELYSIGGEGSIKLKLAGMEASQEIAKPTIDDSIAINLPRSMRQKCAYALQCVALDESRPVLTGVCFDFQNLAFSMASADGFRLIEVREEFESPEQYRFIVPAEPLRILVKHMKGEIAYSYDSAKAMVFFFTSDLSIISQTIQGTYPPYTQLIPDAPPVWTFSCSAPILHKRIGQMTIEGSGIIRLSRPLQKSDEEWLSVMAKSEEVEEDIAMIPVKQNGDGKIALQHKYLFDATAIFSEVTVEVTNPSSPIKMKGDLDGVTVVIMPMFVQWK